MKLVILITLIISVLSSCSSVPKAVVDYKSCTPYGEVGDVTLAKCRLIDLKGL